MKHERQDALFKTWASATPGVDSGLTNLESIRQSCSLYTPGVLFKVCYRSLSSPPPTTFSSPLFGSVAGTVHGAQRDDVQTASRQKANSNASARKATTAQRSARLQTGLQARRSARSGSKRRSRRREMGMGGKTFFQCIHSDRAPDTGPDRGQKECEVRNMTKNIKRSADIARQA